MDLVGPWPERTEFIAEFRKQIPGYMLRHKVKAGITGWIRINVWLGNTSLARRIEHYLFYIEKCLLVMDIKLLTHTPFHGFIHLHAALSPAPRLRFGAIGVGPSLNLVI